MNYLKDNMWITFKLLDDIYFDLNFILVAITIDEVSTLLEQEPEPPNFELLQIL